MTASIREKHPSGQQNRNAQFVLLSAIAMTLVVFGHVDDNSLTIGGLYPYYSFHIPLFVFISGYFYKPGAEENIGRYVAKKAKHLLLPYFLWNCFYGVLVVLLRQIGFCIGNLPNLWTLIVDPFANGHQFGYNAPSWFVTALFLTQISYVILRRILRRLLGLEWILMGICLILGFAVAGLSIRGSVYDWYRIPGRVMYLLPAFQFGVLYKQKLEVRDTLRNAYYFGILLLLQLILTGSCAGLAVSAAWVNGFNNGPIIPYVAAALGILFWLRVSRVLEPALGKSRLLNYYGNHTFAVMMHQLPAIILVRSIFFQAAKILPEASFLAGFDYERHITDIYYVFLPGGQEQFRLLYAAAAILLPLAVAKGLDLIRKKVSAV